MKRMMLLLGLCFCISGLYAHKFETEVLDEGNTYEVRVKHFNKLFGEQFTPEKVASLPPNRAAQREEWREKCADKLLTEDLKTAIKQALKEDVGSFWVMLYTDETGKVITVKFVMSSSIYINISTKMLRELYSRAMKEKLNPEDYLFDGGRTYVLDGFELVKRVLQG